MALRYDLTGLHFNRWVVLKYAGQNRFKMSLWLCRCECGTERVVASANLKRGLSQSCGCLNRELSSKRLRNHKHCLKHGHAVDGKKSSEYNTWQSMNGRCTNPNNTGYELYGQRGITVCPEWRDSFEAFLRDMGPKPLPKARYSIERIDNDGNYEPSNCRWATQSEQMLNQRRSRKNRVEDTPSYTY